MILNYNGFVRREGKTQSGFNSLHCTLRLLWSSWRDKGAPRSITCGELHSVTKRPLARHRNRGRRPLECLPFELLHMILLEACTDGGRTGCSLSLVSKDIRTLSRAARFYSISLLTPSLWKLRLFQQTYDQARDAAIREDAPWTMPRVRHLCLLVDIPNFLRRDNLDVKPAKQDTQHPEYPMQRRFRNHILGNLRTGRHGLPEKLALQILGLESHYRNNAVVTLLQRLAGDLFSLCLFQFPRLQGTPSVEESERRPRVVPVSSFPNLRELWLGGKDKRGAPLFLRGTSFPALKSLHMRSTYDTDILHWLSVAPRLDSLRIVAQPSLLTENEGQRTFMAISAHPIWREKGKQLTIVAPLKRKDPFNWTEFAQRASFLRHTLDEVAGTVAFVPYYATQDVDWRVRKAAEGRRRRWPLARDRRKPAEQDELFRWDWLAHVQGQCDGIYVRDFWAHFVEDSEDEKKHVEESMKRDSWRGPTYVAPFIVRQAARFP